MIPNADWQRQEALSRDTVRYPAWYPWFLRGDRGLPEDRGGGDLGACPVDRNLAVRVRRLVARLKGLSRSERKIEGNDLSTDANWSMSAATSFAREGHWIHPPGLYAPVQSAGRRFEASAGQSRMAPIPWRTKKPSHRPRREVQEELRL